MKKLLVYFLIALLFSFPGIVRAKTTIDATTNIYAPDGTAANPSYSFWNETTLGFYRSGAGVISLVGGTLSALGGSYSLSDADVAHGMTDIAATNVFGLLNALDAADKGGLRIQGLSDGDATPLYFRGIIGSADPTDTLEAVSMVAAKKNGTGVQALGALETAFQWLNNTVELLTILGDGDTIFGPVATPRITIGGGTNDNGIVFGSLGTATRAIDLSSSGLIGATDYLLYFDANNYWTAAGEISSLHIVLNESSSAGGIADIGGTTRWYISASGGNIVNSLLAGGAWLGGNKTIIGSWGGDGVSNGTTTLTDVGGAAHGLSLAAGDLVHITAGTGSVEGFYTIISDNGTNVVVDRAVTAATDLAVTFYKDVIGIFATDGTNGQRIANYSHQNKPLQIGGDVLAATGHSLTSQDVLVGGKLEVNDTVYIDADSVVVAVAQSPASNAACTTGEIAWDASYIYVCTASTVWKRAALTGGY